MILDLDKGTWKRIAFRDIVQNVTDRVDNPSEAGVDRYVGLEHLDPGVLKIRRWDTPDKVEAQKLRFKVGDVIFGRRRAYQKKVALAEFEGICSAHALVLRARPGCINRDFLPVFLASDYFLDRAIDISVGSLSPTVNWRDLMVQEFDLPPLDEQKRIASLFWAVERHLCAVSEFRSDLMGAFLQARLALLTVGPGGPWREVPIPADAADYWTRGVPEGWKAATVGEVSTVRAGATPSRSQQARYFDGGTIPWVKTLDLNESVISVTEESISDSALSESSARIVPEGTVLVAMYGGFGQIGRTAQLGIDAATNQAVSALLNLRADVLPRFMHEVLKAGRPKWRKVAASSRKDPNITKRDVERFDFPLPPLSEQKQMLGLLARIQGGINSLDGERRALKLLRAALLAETFGDER
ncbi:restriction endonuclease subunit S [Micromonospora carbonacea]|uniref:restriction endonuclease subunit S n=1 Tax=Micromonospora carbonacea TaxID=47853 RepID=UPI003713BEDA